MFTDPGGGDFSLLPLSPARGYGCQTFRLPGHGRASASAGPPGHAPESGRGRDPGFGPGRTGAWKPSSGALSVVGTRSSIDASGPIFADTEWDADTVRVTGDLLVHDQALLRIRPGVRVEFQGHYSMEIQGSLVALGTPSMPVLFTSSNPGLYGIDSTLAGSWGGLRFTQTPAWNPTSRLEHCIIEYAKNAGGPGRGGAVYVDGAPRAGLYNCIIRHNAADFGGAFFLTRNASIRIAGCLIHDNHAFRGGSAVYCANSYPILTNNTITANVVLNPDIFEDTGTIHTYIAKPRLTNCISWGNVCDFFIPGEVLWGKLHYLTYSNLGIPHEGAGNFSLDPQFLGDGPHPFAVGGSSPCRNAGDPVTRPEDLPVVDLRGMLRFLEGRIDVGAYEWGDVADVAGDDLLGRPSVAGGVSAYPNPSWGGTRISFAAGDAREYRAGIYDLSGRRIRSIAGRTEQSAPTEFTWDGLADCGRDAGSGVFLCRILLDGVDSRACKVVRLRE